MAVRSTSVKAERDGKRPSLNPKSARRSAEEIKAGVRRQREHIAGLDGADPLRGGVDD